MNSDNGPNFKETPITSNVCNTGSSNSYQIKVYMDSHTEDNIHKCNISDHFLLTQKYRAKL